MRVKFSALFAGLVASVGMLASPSASAQAFPSKPIHLVVPFVAGGATDLTARIVAEGMSKNLGVTVVVENRPGANNQIGAEYLVRSPADGYIIMIATTSTMLLPQTNKALTLDLAKDLAPITWLVQSPTVFAASAKAPFKTFNEFLIYARANPGKVNYGAGGAGDLLAGEFLKVLAGINVVTVMYKGGNDVTQALLKNEIQYMIAFPGYLKPFVDAGQAVNLAVTSKTRYAPLPNLPAVAEFNMPDFEYLGWSGLVAPAGAPRAVIDRLNRAAVEALQTPSVKAGLAKLGFDIVASTPENFGKLINGEMSKWKRVADQAGIKPQ